MSGLRIRWWSWPVLIGLLAGVVPGAASGQGHLVESVEVRCLLKLRGDMRAALDPARLVARAGEVAPT
jgi:hypothetical protein